MSCKVERQEGNAWRVIREQTGEVLATTPFQNVAEILCDELNDICTPLQILPTASSADQRYAA